MHLLAATNRFWKSIPSSVGSPSALALHDIKHNPKAAHQRSWMALGAKAPRPTNLTHHPKATNQEFFQYNLASQRAEVDTDTHTHGGGHSNFTQVLTLG